MATKILTGTYSAGYTIAAGVTTLRISPTGYVEGAGVSTPAGVSGAYTVSNYGRVVAAYADKDNGVYLGHGGRVSNGSPTQTKALIEGYRGVKTAGAAASVQNFGTIEGLARSGVYLAAGGTVVNGATSDTGAVIIGGNGSLGVSAANAAGVLQNFGTVSAGICGVYFSAGGAVTNGSAADTSAVIDATQYEGVLATAASVTVTNFGAINAPGTGSGSGAVGVYLAAGGTVTNQAGGTISGSGAGVYITGAAGAVTNHGAIKAGSATGVGLFAGGVVINGGAGDSAATIAGASGVVLVNGTGTVINFGTIVGTGNAAVNFGSSSDVLVVAGGSSLVGAILGDGGTLELGSGPATLSGLGGTVTITSSPSPETFTNFGKVEIAAGAQITAAGANRVGGIQPVTIDGTLLSAGSLNINTTLGGAGTLAFTAGTAILATGTALTVANVTQAGASRVAVTSASLAYAGRWTQTSGTLAVGAHNTISFSGAGDSFAGTINGAGAVVFSGGSDTLAGANLSTASAVISGAAVTLAGTITHAGALSVTTANLVIDAGGATLTGGGSLILSNTASNRIMGATSAATLTNVEDVISGAGSLGGGQMTLVNDARGVIDGNAALALTLDTGAATIVNAGLIKAGAGGGVIIQSPLNNNGRLETVGGTLSVNGAVTGTGQAVIAGGLLTFTSTFNERATFLAAGGVLQLARSQSYTGKVSGFSKTGATTLDLRDIGFVGAGEASFAGTTGGGVLTVTDGAHTARITLIGDYLGSTFTAASDGQGGTLVTDPAPTAANTLPLIAAMAATAVPAAPAATASRLPAHVHPFLTAPGQCRVG